MRYRFQAEPQEGALREPLCYADLKGLAQERGCPVHELYALAPQNDPFYADAPARKKAAEWFADLWHRMGLSAGVHLRRIHYRLVSQAEPIRMVDGTPYLNTERCWQMLLGASKAARYLNFVPASCFVDRRNDEPIVHLTIRNALGYLTTDFTSLSQAGEELLRISEMPWHPELSLVSPTVGQQYHLEIWAEKTTVNDVLVPLAQRYGLNIVTGSGELSLTACELVLERVRMSGRPVRILYISDFDPAGMSMPVAVARKIEFLHRRSGLNLDIQVRPVVLTVEQCREYALPRTPIKETERRAASFEARFGSGATELDALEALHPGTLQQILRREIERYFDTSLERRVAAVTAELRAQLRAINQDVERHHAEALERLRVERQAIQQLIRTALQAWEHRAQQVWDSMAKALAARAPNFASIEWPQPMAGEEDPEPLFDSRRDYFEQMAVYKRHQGRAPAGNRDDIGVKEPEAEIDGEH